MTLGAHRPCRSSAVYSDSLDWFHECWRLVMESGSEGRVLEVVEEH